MPSNRFLLAFAITGMGIAIPVTLARHTGAAAGYSGGPAGEGDNCTACHTFNFGPGRVQLLGAPQRYRSGAIYDLTVRVIDPAQAGAGFEISAEGVAGHPGTLMVSDPNHTQFANGNSKYVTHTTAGYSDSVTQWPSNGGAYDYHVRWRAPTTDMGRLTFFVAGLAVDDAQGFEGDRYYAEHKTIGHAVPGDADSDRDLDLFDFARLQNCFDDGAAPVAPGCEYVDVDGDMFLTLDDVGAFVDAITGPTAPLPGGYVMADPIRGGRLYDTWWNVNRAPPPTGTHPLYPPLGQQAGSDTFRCQECHGWDYKGRDGVFGSGPHFTNIAGVFGTSLSAQEIFDLLKADPALVPGGHNMDAYGMTDADLWDVVRMILEGVVDTDDYIDPAGAFLGSELFGQVVFNRCSSCHGEDGTNLNFGSAKLPEYVGTVATENPWEFLHKARFGNPGTPMPSQVLLGLTPEDLADLGAYATTLPTQ